MGNNLTKNTNAFDLKKYLHDIYELEKKKYILKERIKQLEDEKFHKEISHYSIYQSPEFEQSEYYNRYIRECRETRETLSIPNDIYKKSSIIATLIITFGIVGFFIGAFTGCSMTLSKTSSGNVIWPLFVFPIIGIFAGGIIGGIVDAYNQNKYDKDRNWYIKENEKIHKENLEIEYFNREKYFSWKKIFEDNEIKKIKQDKERESNFNTAKLVQINYLEKEIAIIKTSISELENALDNMYNLSINGNLCLHRDYRGLETISVIYRYFDVGRCTTLQGHEGAYNLFEQEKRLGYIDSKLDNISDKLDNLDITMSYLGNAIFECSDKLEELNENTKKTINAIEYMESDISNQLGNVSDNINGMSNNINNKLSSIEIDTKNSAYYSEVGAEAASFSAYYNLLKG